MNIYGNLQKRWQKCYSLNAGFNLGLATGRGSLKCALFYINFPKRYHTSSTLAGSRELEVLKRPLPGAAANTSSLEYMETRPFKSFLLEIVCYQYLYLFKSFEKL